MLPKEPRLSSCITLFRSALAFYKTQRYERVHEACRNILDYLNETPPSLQRTVLLFDTWYMLGDVQRQQSHLLEALWCYTQALCHVTDDTPQYIHTTLLNKAGVTAYKASQEIDIHGEECRGLKRYAKLCFEQCVSLNSTTPSSEHLLLQAYLDLGDIPRALNLARYLVARSSNTTQVSSDLTWFAQQTVTQLPVLAFNISSLMNTHQFPRASPLSHRPQKKSTIALSLKFPSRFGISRKMLRMLFSSGFTIETLLENVDRFVTHLTDQLQKTDGCNVHYLMNIPLLTSYNDFLNADYLEQLGIYPDTYPRSETTPEVAEVKQHNPLLRTLRPSKESQKKSVEPASADVYHKTSTVFSELVDRLNDFFTQQNDVYDEANLVTNGLPHHGLATIEPFPSLENTISSLAHSHFHTTWNDEETLGSALLYNCSRFLLRRSHLLFPQAYVALMMKIFPFVNEGSRKRNLHHALAILHASLHLDSPDVPVMRFALESIATLCEKPRVLWYQAYALFIVSLRTHHRAGLRCVLQKLPLVDHPSISQHCVDSVRDVAHLELSLMEFSFQPIDKHDLSHWIASAMGLHSLVQLFSSVVSKWYTRSSLVVPEINVINSPRRLTTNVQIVCDAVLSLFQYAIPYFSQRRVAHERERLSNPDSVPHLVFSTHETKLIDLLLMLTGNILLLQSFVAQHLVTSFHCSSLQSYLEEAVSLGFPTSQYPPNTFVSTISPFLSSLSGAQCDMSETQRISSDSPPSKVLHPCLKPIHINEGVLPRTTQVSMLDSSESGSSSTVLSIDSESDHAVDQPPEYTQQFESPTFFASARVCIEGCFSLLKQDIAICKIVCTSSRKPLDRHKKTLLYSLVTRVRFLCRSCVTLLCSPVTHQGFSLHQRNDQNIHDSQRENASSPFCYVTNIQMSSSDASFSLVQYMDCLVHFLRKVLEMEIVFFSSMNHQLHEEQEASNVVSLYGYHALFLTPDVLSLPQWVMALYQETWALQPEAAWANSALTCCRGLGTLNTSLHILSTCLRCFSSCRVISRWLRDVSRMVDTITTALKAEGSIEICTSQGTPITEIARLADYLPYCLRSTIFDTVDRDLFNTTRAKKFTSFQSLGKRIPWDSEMHIAETLAIALMGILGLPVYPHGPAPFDSCRLLNAQDYEHSVNRIANETERLGLPFRIASPAALLLGVAVYKKLCRWYTDSSHRHHYPKAFRSSLAEAIESCVFIDAADPLSEDHKEKPRAFIVNIKCREPSISYILPKWKVKHFGLWTYLSDPLLFPSILEVFDDEQPIRHGRPSTELHQSQLPDSGVSDASMELYTFFFDAWQNKWPSLKRYGVTSVARVCRGFDTYQSTETVDHKLLHLLLRGGLLCTQDVDFLLASWAPRDPEDNVEDHLLREEEAALSLSARTMRTHSAMLYFPFQSASSHASMWAARLRPFTDVQYSKVATASILSAYFLDFCSASCYTSSLIAAFLFHVLPLRPVLYFPHKLRRIAFESSLWGDRFGFFFKETHVAQPTADIRRNVSYLPAYLFTHGAYATHILEMNDLLDNLANINRAASLGYSNIKIFSSAAYTHRQLFLMLDDRASAEECWLAVLPHYALNMSSESSCDIEEMNRRLQRRHSHYAEIPLREGVQSLFLLNLEQHLLGHLLFTRALHCTSQTMSDPNSLQPGKDTPTSTKTTQGFGTEPDAFLKSTFPRTLDLNNPCHILHQQEHLLQTQLRSESSGVDTPENDDSLPTQTALESRKNIVVQLLTPVKPLSTLGFLDVFVLYARCRIEHLLVHFVLLKRLYPLPSGLTLSFLMEKRRDQHQHAASTYPYGLYQLTSRHLIDANLPPDVRRSCTKRLQLLYTDAQDIGKMVGNATEGWASALLSRKPTTPNAPVLSHHTVTLFKSVVWIAPMILARLCLLQSKFHLLYSQHYGNVSLNYYIYLLRAVVFLCESLRCPSSDTHHRELITTPSLTKQRDHLPPHFKFITRHEAPPLIRLVSLRVYLFLLGFLCSNTLRSDSTNKSHTKVSCSESDQTQSLQTETVKSQLCAIAKTTGDYTTRSSTTSVPISTCPVIQSSQPTPYDGHTQKPPLQSSPLDPAHCCEGINCDVFDVPDNPSENSTTAMRCRSSVTVSCAPFLPENSQCINNRGLQEPPPQAMLPSESRAELGVLFLPGLLSASTVGERETSGVDSHAGSQNTEYISTLIPKEDKHEPDNTATFKECEDVFPSLDANDTKGLQSSGDAEPPHLAWLICAICPWKSELLSPTTCQALHKLCDIYETRLEDTPHAMHDRALHTAFGKELREFVMIHPCASTLNNDCREALNGLIPLFGRHFGKLYAISSRLYAFTGNPKKALDVLEPSISKGVHRLNGFFDGKPSSACTTKHNDSSVLLYQQMLHSRLQHEEKMKYNHFLILLLILDVFVEMDGEDPGTPDPPPDAEHSTAATLAPGPTAITLDLPPGLLSARIVQWLPHSSNSTSKIPSCVQQHWKIVRQCPEPNIHHQAIVDLICYLIDLLHLHVRNARKQQSTPHEASTLLNLSNDSRGLSHMVCQTVFVALFIFCDVISDRIKQHQLLLPWEVSYTQQRACARPLNVHLISPLLLKRFGSLLPILPKENEALKKRFTQFLARMANTLLVHEAQYAATHATVAAQELKGNGDDQILDVLADCRLRAGPVQLVLRVRRDHGTYRYVEPLTHHHVTQHHQLSTIFKNSIHQKRGHDPKRMAAVASSDKVRKKIKQTA